MRAQYSFLGLKTNPFPRIPIPSYPPQVTLDTQGVVKRILWETRYTFETGITNVVVVVGPYGSGKTHHMLAAIADLEKVHNVLTVYIPSPGKSVLTLHRAYIEAVGSDRLSELASGNDKVDRVLRLLEDEEHAKIVYAWLSGDAVEGKYRYKLGLGTKLDEFSSVKLLSDLINRLYSRGITSLIFLDEVESILSLQPYQREIYFSALRRLLDLTPRGLFLALSVTPAGWDAILSSAYALARRVSRNVIFIKPLSLEEAGEVLKLYVRTAGGDPSIFTPDAVEELYKASNGIVGELVRFAGLALDLAALKGMRRVNREVVMEALSIYGGFDVVGV